MTKPTYESLRLWIAWVAVNCGLQNVTLGYLAG